MKLMTVMWALLLALWSATCMAGNPSSAGVSRIRAVQNPPAHYAVHIGDVLVRRVDIDTPAGVQLEASQLPKPGQRVEDILLLRIDRDTGESSADQTHQRLTLHYQVFHTATEAVALSLPAVVLPLSDGSQLTLPAWKFWYAPLAKSSLSKVKAELLPFATAPNMPTAGLKIALLTSLGLMALSLLTLCYLKLDWHWLPWMRGPFSRAYARIRTLHASQQPEALAQMATEIHAALNQVYGQCLFASDIPRFVSLTPRYAKASTTLTDFFALSNHLLFAQSASSPAVSQQLLACSKLLRDCERGAA